METKNISVGCSCGKVHSCDIKYIYIENDAVRHLRNMCAGYENILVVADENTYRAAGDKALSYLEDKNITTVIFSGSTLLIPDESAISAVRQKLGGNELILGIGSGVIQDICKYISFFDNVPYYIVATAPSMDGYASSTAAMIFGGMKTSCTAKVPDGFVGDTEILKNAPLPMIKAGYGDIMGKFSALCDWKLSHTVLGEYFCGEIYRRVLETAKQLIPLGKRLLLRDEEAIKSLTEALVSVGTEMSYAESSRPASGSEHHLSHFFEITGILNGESYLPHGIDVAYSSVLTARIREKLLNCQLPEKQYSMNRDRYHSEMKRVFKDISEDCIGLHRKTGFYNTDRISLYRKNEAEIRQILSEMPTADETEHILSETELDMNDFYSTYTKQKLRDALLYAKDLKDRYTVLWMNYDIFGDLDDE